MKIVIGIDPSTKRCGFAAIDPVKRELLHVELIESKHDDARLRIKEIFDQVHERIALLDPELGVEVYLESTVMRGKGGETLARMTGALMAAVPASFHCDLVHNTTMKKHIGGHGKAEKDEVAFGVENWFARADLIPMRSSKSSAQVGYLRGHEEFDQTDAIAIAICGYERRLDAKG